MQFMLAAVEDCATQLEKCCHLAASDQLLIQFKDEVYGYIKEYVSFVLY